MSTIPVNLKYRPLRVGWCVEAGDIEAFRKAVRWTFTLWGGRYNPIIPIDDPEFATRLIAIYRVDTLVAATTSDAVKAFIDGQKHLPDFDFRSKLVIDRGRGEKASMIADLSNPIGRLYDEQFRHNPAAEPAIRLHSWQDDDPLADMFLTSLGGLPPTDEIAEDYEGQLRLHLRAEPAVIQPDQPVGFLPLTRMSLAGFGTLYLERHYTVRNKRADPGFFVGDASSMDDLVAYWNLRAADVPILFYDPAHAERLAQWRADWIMWLPLQNSPHRRAAVTTLWHREVIEVPDHAVFGEHVAHALVGPNLWNGLNVSAPYMIFGEASTLASVDKTTEPPSITIPVQNNPVHSESAFDQVFVISVDPGIGLSQDERFTLHLPFLPELNEFYGRNIYWRWNKARSEPGGLGIISGARTTHVSLRAVEITQLITAVFKTVGIAAEPSAAGLVGSRLVHQMGGIDRCRVFRIGGVRELIERYAPDQSFTQSAAKQIIRAHGQPHALAKYQDLYIEPRDRGAALTNDAVFAHLLRKEIFRPGLKLDCPNCKLAYWRSIDDVSTRNECEYCGHISNIGPQLRDRDWAFRRSGLFGRNDSQEGTIPVTLTLQQLINFHDLSPNLVTMAMALTPDGADIPDCETDFVFLAPGGRNGPIQLLIGECKTRHPITEQDVANLRRVADAFPPEKFEVYVVFAKLAEFTADEIAHIQTLNDERRRRAIMLTTRELEPWFVYERAEEVFDIQKVVVTFTGMADNTHDIFFEPRLKAMPEDAGQ